MKDHGPAIVVPVNTSVRSLTVVEPSLARPGEVNVFRLEWHRDDDHHPFQLVMIPATAAEMHSATVRRLLDAGTGVVEKDAAVDSALELFQFAGQVFAGVARASHEDGAGPRPNSIDIPIPPVPDKDPSTLN